MKWTEKQIPAELRRLQWRQVSGLWKTDKRRLKRHTAHGLTLREAASIEGLTFTANEDARFLVSKWRES